MSYYASSRAVVNSLGMPITIWDVKGQDGITYAETRYQQIALRLANEMTANKWRIADPKPEGSD